MLGRERPPQARCDIPGHHGGLDQECPRAAAGVVEGTAAIPAAQLQHGGGHCLLQRSLGNELAVTPLVQRGSRRVQRDQSDVVQQGHFNNVAGSVLGEPVGVVLHL
ncbi:hypothetical protein D3C75_1129310 [compost metagenome]